MTLELNKQRSLSRAIGATVKAACQKRGFDQMRLSESRDWTHASTDDPLKFLPQNLEQDIKCHLTSLSTSQKMTFHHCCHYKSYLYFKTYLVLSFFLN